MLSKHSGQAETRIVFALAHILEDLNDFPRGKGLGCQIDGETGPKEPSARGLGESRQEGLDDLGQGAAATLGSEPSSQVFKSCLPLRILDGRCSSHGEVIYQIGRP